MFDTSDIIRDISRDLIATSSRAMHQYHCRIEYIHCLSANWQSLLCTNYLVHSTCVACKLDLGYGRRGEKDVAGAIPRREPRFRLPKAKLERPMRLTTCFRPIERTQVMRQKKSVKLRRKEMMGTHKIYIHRCGPLVKQ